VRRYAWLGKHVIDSYCLTCGECVNRCPVGCSALNGSNYFGAPTMTRYVIVGQGVAGVSAAKPSALLIAPLRSSS